MADYTFPAAPVYVEGSGGFAVGATGVLRPAAGGDPVPIYDLNDSPLPNVLVGSQGAHQPFKADIPDGVLDFGSVQLVAISMESFRAALTAVESAESARSQVELLQTSKASTIHFHTSSDVTDFAAAVAAVGGGGGGGGGGTGFIDGGTANSTFSDTIIDGGGAAQ